MKKYQNIEKFTTDTIKYFNTKNLEDLLVKHIVTVTFYHEHVGNMLIYVLHPETSNIKIYEKTAYSMDSYFRQLVLGG